MHYLLLTTLSNSNTDFWTLSLALVISSLLYFINTSLCRATAIQTSFHSSFHYFFHQHILTHLNNNLSFLSLSFSSFLYFIKTSSLKTTAKLQTFFVSAAYHSLLSSRHPHLEQQQFKVPSTHQFFLLIFSKSTVIQTFPTSRHPRSKQQQFNSSLFHFLPLSNSSFKAFIKTSSVTTTVLQHSYLLSFFSVINTYFLKTAALQNFNSLSVHHAYISTRHPTKSQLKQFLICSSCLYFNKRPN